jgi:Flp pilus assembly protein TadG
MLPVILIILAGLTDLGLAFFMGMRTQNAVREGARIASTITGLGANDSTIQNAVVNRILPVGGVYTITTGNVTNNAPTSADCTATITVTATGVYNYMFLRYIGFTNTQITRSTTMRYEAGIKPCGV